MISESLLAVVCCPACGSSLRTEEGSFACAACARRYAVDEKKGYLDLRPPEGTFADLTAYAEEEFHSRPGPIKPPFLSAGVKFDMMREFLNVSRTDRVLDIGCGNGRAVFFLRGHCGQVAGIDAGAHFAPEAEQAVDLVRGDIRRLPFVSGGFDKAFSLDVLEHLSEDGVRAVLGEARRVLRPGGLLFLYSHVMMSSGIASFQRGVTRLVHWLDARGLVDNAPERARKSDHVNDLKSYAQLEALLESTGFTIEKIRYYNVVFKAVVEDLLLPLAEHNLFRRPSNQGLASPKPSGNTEAKAGRPAVGRWAHGPLALATAVLKLDVWCFGRIRTGPFFLLLRAR